MNPDELAQLIVSEVKSFTARAVSDLEARLRSEFEERLKAIPQARDGRDGVDGINGKDGLPGERGEKGEPGERGMTGEKGLDGKDGAPGEKGEAGERGGIGEKGIDGKDGRDAVDGRDGRDGKDGIGKHEIHEAVTEALIKAIPGVVDIAVIETMKALPPPMTYKDVWSPDVTYEPGHSVTLGGSLWHCNKQTTVRPDGGTTDWTLAVKRGKDGKSVSPVVKA